MDFFDINFSRIFLEKHKKKAFNSVVKQINLEKENASDNDIEVVFKFAFFDFFGMDEIDIKNFIENIMPGIKVNVGEIKSIHEKSISDIQKFLKDVMEDKK